MNELLEAIRKNPEFTAVLRESLKHRPVIPAFVISETQEQQYMVIENIKNYTMMQRGFDQLYQYLTGRKPE
jgi:hypothetical protein